MWWPEQIEIHSGTNKCITGITFTILSPLTPMIISPFLCRRVLVWYAGQAFITLQLCLMVSMECSCNSCTNINIIILWPVGERSLSCDHINYVSTYYYRVPAHRVAVNCSGGLYVGLTLQSIWNLLDVYFGTYLALSSVYWCLSAPPFVSIGNYLL